MIRRVTRLSVLLFGCISVLLLPHLASAQAERFPHRPGEVIIKFEQTASEHVKSEILADLGASQTRSLRRIRARHSRITRMSVAEALARYRTHPEIEFIEPNYIYTEDMIPNDPRFDELWGLLNTGQTGGTSGADISADLAWEVQTGSREIVVAVIDTGIDYTHPDLAGNIWVNPDEIAANGIDDDSNGFVDDVRGWDFANGDNDPMDDRGHGTHVAGTIGALGDNDLGVVGVNWQVTLMPLKFLGADGYGTTVDAISCVDYATQMGVHLTNNSWGGGAYSEALSQAIERAGEAGILFVAAAGNSGLNADIYPHYPGSYDLPSVISVAATDHNDVLAGFSNYGVASVDLAAPGVSTLSTIPGGGYSHKNGTSMASPHVAGALALILAHSPGIDAVSAKALILDRVDPVPALAGLVLSGGRLNVFMTIAESDDTAPAAIDDLATLDAESTRVDLAWTASGDDGLEGTARRYDVRYSTSPIDEANFSSAAEAPDAPRPSPSGSPERMTAGGLEFETTHYFAIKAIDELGNVSPMSNVALGTTLGPPDLGASTDGLHADLITGGTATRVLTLQNTGEGEAIFDVFIEGSTVVALESGGSAASTMSAGSRLPQGFQSSAALPQATTTYAPGETAETVVPVITTSENVLTTGLNLAILSGGLDVDYFRSHLELQPDIASVDVLGLGSTAPSLETLLVYDAVVLAVNSPLEDPVGVGNVLADYVDNGAGLIMTLASIVSGWTPSGRLLDEGYFPYLNGSGPIGSSSLGDHDPLHPIMDEVTTLWGDLLASLTVAPDAELIASWANGEPLAATKGPNVVGLNLFLGASAWSGDAPRLVRNSALWSARRARWLTVEPSAGAVPGGGSLDLLVHFDAAGLDEGDYEAEVVVISSDPDQPEIRVPASAHVTAAPDVELSRDRLDFGLQWVGFGQDLGIVVFNRGFQPLDVTGIAVSHDDFSMDTTAFSVAPGENQLVTVTFTPSGEGPVTATLTIDSNDPDEPSLGVALQGEGVTPPEIFVQPGALAEELFTGESLLRTLTVRNDGGSDLILDIDFDYTLAPEGTGAEQSTAAATGAEAPLVGDESSQVRPEDFSPPPSEPVVMVDAEVLIIQNSAPWGSSATQQILTLNGIAYDQIAVSSLGSTDLSPYRMVIVSSDQPTSFYSAFAAQETMIDDYVSQGGTLQFHAAGWGWSGGDASLVTLPAGMQIIHGSADLNYLLEPEHPLVAGVSNPFSGSGASHAYFLGIPGAATSVVADSSGRVNLVVYPHGRGTVIAGGQTFEYGYDHGQEAGTILSNMIPWAYALGPDWLWVEPEAVLVPAGGSVDIQVTFDAAGLPGGDYGADIHLTSVYPEIDEIVVPVTLHVTAAPDIEVAPEELHFGVLFIGAASEMIVTVRNKGTDLLNVSSVTSDHVDFVADTASFSVAVGESHAMAVTFSPSTPTIIDGTLTLGSDDPDEGETVVPLRGVGLIPPDIAVTPESLSEHLFTDEIITRTLVVANDGGSDLTFNVGGAEPAAAAALSITAPVGILDEGLYLDGVSYEVDPGVQQPPSVPAAIIPPPAGSTIVNFDGQGAPCGFWYITALRDQYAGLGVYFDGPGGSDGGAILDECGSFGVSGHSRPNFLAFNTSASLAGGGTPRGPETITFEPTSSHVQINAGSYNGGTVTMEAYNASGTLVDVDSIQSTSGLSTLVVQGAAISSVVIRFTGQTLVLDDLAFSNQWLSVNPSSGVVPAGGSTELTVTLNATDLFGGLYESSVSVISNDPDEAQVVIPVTLEVTGVPDIELSPGAIDYGALYIGLSSDRTLTILNDGTDVLNVAAISVDNTEFSVDVPPFSLGNGESRDVVIRYTPTIPGGVSATLTIASDDPDEGLLELPLSGMGVIPPEIDVSPAVLAEDLVTNETALHPLTISNNGGSDLDWTIELVGEGLAGDLEGVLESLDAGFADVTERIPQRYDFRDGVSGYYISDGGYDMYDGGNYLGTDLGNYIYYSDGTVREGYQFGTAGRYFTRKYPGLFVLVADMQGVEEFSIDGNLGADGSGNADGAVLHASSNGKQYLGFVKRVYNAGDPSVNHLVIVEHGPGIDHEFSTYTNNDHHRVFGLGGSERIYYLLYAGSSGEYIDDDATLEIMNAFLDTAVPLPPWLALSGYAGTLPPDGSAELTVTFDATGMFGGDYSADVVIRSNDIDDPELTVPATLHVTGVPDIVLSATVFDYAPLYIGLSSEQTLTILNDGTDVLNVSALSVDNADFSFDTQPFSLGFGESRDLLIGFAPTVPGIIAGTLTIVSDDPDEGVLTVALSGEGVVPPDIDVDPIPLEEALVFGETSTRTLTISNLGGSDLDFDLGVYLVSPASMTDAPPLEFADEDDPGTDPDPSNLDPDETGSPTIVPPGSWQPDPVEASFRFSDDFEDGSINGWEVIDRTDNKLVTSLTAANGSLRSYHEYSSTVGHYNGIRRDLGSVQPGYISFWVRSGSATQSDAYFVLNDSYGSEAIFFYADWNGRFYLNFDTGGDNSVYYVTNTWYHIEFVNIDFTTKSFDYRVNGQTIKSPVNFRNPFTVDDLATLHLYNFSGGSMAWWDEILLSAASPADWLTLDPTSGTVPVGDAEEVTATFDATVAGIGSHQAEIEIGSNDPDEPSVIVPVSFDVRGEPNIRVSPGELDFGTVFLGLSEQRTLTVSNIGSEVLEVTGISSDHADFAPDVTSFDLDIGDARDVTVSFSPAVDGPIEGMLTIESNDPDEALLTLTLAGAGLVPPEIVASPASLEEDLFAGFPSTRTVRVDNVGGSDLTWAATLLGGDAGGTLEQVLETLDANYQAVTALIPFPWDISDGVHGDHIADGGRDMYDNGNYLETDLGGFIQYSDGVIVESELFGTRGRYFTRKYPGLFVLVADMAGADAFTISGDLGADGLGAADGNVLDAEVQGTEFQGFVKRVYNASDPSVNHLIIITRSPGVEHEFSSDTRDDYHRVHGLSGTRRIYYLLYAGQYANYINDFQTTNIMNAFLGLLPSSSAPSWVVASPQQGIVTAGAGQNVELTFNPLLDREPGTYEANLDLESNDPFNGLVTVPITLNVHEPPDIGLPAGEVSSVSMAPFTGPGAVTQHSLVFDPPPAGSGSIDLEVNGAFGDAGATATLLAEGDAVGTVGGQGLDCETSAETFPLDAAWLGALAADGIAEFQVVNSALVEPVCPENSHTVRLTYERALDELDFGTLFTGTDLELPLEIVNYGAGALEIYSVDSGNPEISVSETSLLIPPFGSASISLNWAPLVVGALDTTLTIVSNDPDEPAVEVRLAGDAIPPPVAQLDPASLVAALPPHSGLTKTRGVQVGNSGGSDLIWEIETAPWVSAVPASGVVPPGEAVEVVLTLSSAALDEGDYVSMVTLHSNDPFNNPLESLLTLHVREVVLDDMRIDRAPRADDPTASIHAMLQLPGPYHPRDVLVSTVSLWGELFAAPGPFILGDRNLDGVPDLTLRFDSGLFQKLITQGGSVPITITGEVEDQTWFSGTVLLRVESPWLVYPTGGEFLLAGQTETIQWVPGSADGRPVYEIWISRDAGESWALLATDLAATTYSWTVELPATGEALVRVYAWIDGEVCGYATSDEEFAIQDSPRPPGEITELHLAAEGGDLVLSWQPPPTGLEQGPASYYRVLRATSPTGPFEEVSVTAGTTHREEEGLSGEPASVYYEIVAGNGAGESAGE